MDIVSSAAAVVGLVFNFATAIKTCNDLRNRYKDAARTIKSIKHELETTQGALQGIANLMMHDADALASRWDSNKTLPTTFARAIKGFKNTINGLLDDMEPLKRNDSRLGKMDKVKLLWNEDAMKEHLGQLRAQSSALNLLLTVLQTGTLSEVRSNIAKVEAALIHLSVSAKDSEELTSARPPEYETHILDDQSDLLDLEWPDDKQNANPGQRQSIHTDALGTAVSSKTTNAEIEGNCHEKFQSTPSSSITQPSIKTDLPMVTLIEDASAPLESISNQANQSNTAGINSSSYPPVVGASPKGDSAAHRALYTKPIPSNTKYDLHRNSCVENTRSPESPFYNLSPYFDPDVSYDTVRNFKNYALPEGSDGLGVGADQMGHVPNESLPYLIRAVMKANVEEVRTLLEFGHDIESRHPTSHRTALLLVAALGNIELLQMLLARNAYVDAKDIYGRTALHYAVSEGHFRCVQLLLPAGASATVYDKWDECPLHRAVRYGSLNNDGLKMLLSQYPNPLQLRTTCGFTILHLVAKWGSPTTAKLICETLQTVEHRPNCPMKVIDSHPISESCDCPLVFPGLDIEDHEGRTALQNAIYRRAPKQIEILLKYSPVAVNAPQPRERFWHSTDLQGGVEWERPLHYAIRVKPMSGEVQEHLIDVLLEADPDLSLLDSRGQTPLEVAILFKNQSAAQALLHRRAPFIGTSDSSGNKSLLGKAIEQFPPTVLFGLLASAPRSNIVTSRELGVAVIREAQSMCKWDYIQVFLKSRNVSKTWLRRILNEEQTLKFAIREANEDAVNSLLDAGAEPVTNFTTSVVERCQAVHIAAEGCSIPILKILLRHGVSVLTEDSAGDLPVHHAIQYSDCNMIKACLDAMIRELDRTREGFHERLWKPMYVSIRLACRYGSVEKVKLILELAKKEKVLETFSGGVLHIAVAWGHIHVVECLLEQGYDPQDTRKVHGTLQSVLEMSFHPIYFARDQLPNKLVDFEKCRAIIQKAIDQKETKPPGRTSKKKEKSSCARKSG